MSNPDILTLLSGSHSYKNLNFFVIRVSISFYVCDFMRSRVIRGVGTWVTGQGPIAPYLRVGFAPETISLLQKLIEIELYEGRQRAADQ